MCIPYCDIKKLVKFQNNGVMVCVSESNVIDVFKYFLPKRIQDFCDILRDMDDCERVSRCDVLLSKSPFFF